MRLQPLSLVNSLLINLDHLCLSQLFVININHFLSRTCISFSEIDMCRITHPSRSPSFSLEVKNKLVGSRKVPLVNVSNLNEEVSVEGLLLSQHYIISDRVDPIPSCSPLCHSKESSPHVGGRLGSVIMFDHGISTNGCRRTEYLETLKL